MRCSSLASMKRFSNTFSVMMQLPPHRARRAIVWACMSVGKPGNGSVWMSVAWMAPVRLTVQPSSNVLMSSPMSSYFLSTSPRCLGLKPLTVTGSPHSPPIAMNVPASMRSPTTRWLSTA